MASETQDAVRLQGPTERARAPRWRDVAVSGITTAAVEAWVSQLTAGGLSASRTRQAYLVLSGVLGVAVKAWTSP